MKLSFNKIVDVLELENEIKDIKDVITKYQSIQIDETKSIEIDSYNLYATTKDQIDRLVASKNLLKALNELNSLNVSLSLPRVAQNLNRTLTVKHNGTLEINSSFVIGGMTR